MSRRNAWLSACLSVICCVLPMSAQQPATSPSTRSNVVVPPLVNFSGVLTDLDGKPLSSVTGVTFLLYKEEQGGAPLWMETQNVVPDKNGHYAVMLGSTTSTGLPADIFVAGEARWMGVQPQGQVEQPRILLLSVPYALKAADAQTVGGLPPSAFVLAAPPISSARTATPTTGTQPLAPGATPVTTAGGTINKLAKYDATADITSSQVFDNGTNVGIGNTAPATKLDVTGAATVRGLLSLPTTGTATATAGKNSQPIGWTASAFNSGTATAVNQIFRWQAEPVGNNTATTSGTLNLLYATGTATPTETGLKVAGNGRITFAAGQTFPGTGNGSVTSVGSGLGVSGGPITTSGTLAINTSVVPQLVANNKFTGNQTIIGRLGINTTVAPSQSLEVDSGNAVVRGPGNFKAAGNTGFLYIGDTSHPIEAIWNTGLAIGAYKVPSAVFIQDGTGNVGIGTTTPAYTLDLHGTANFTGPVTFASGQTVNGNLSATGVVTGSNYQIGSNVFAFGSYANQNAFLGFAGNTAMVGSMVGLGNTGIGYQALNSNVGDFEDDGSGNTAVGYRALYTNNDTSNGGGLANGNTAVGSGALSSNTTGSSNTADGGGALSFNTTGGKNTAEGSGALFDNITGNDNTAAGDNALYYNTTGSYNTADGEEALAWNKTGDYNTALGYYAQVGSYNLTNLTNATAIGAHANVTQSNSIVLGSINGVNYATASTKVGIGTAAPSNVFTIGQGAGHAIADGWDTYSSRRWKTNIHMLHGALGKVEQLRGVSYDLKDSGKHEIGVIAEEVGAVVPEVVTWEKNGTDAQSVDYGRLTSLLIEATKEQQALIREQKERITAQQEQIALLTRQVKTIQAALGANGRRGGVRRVKADETNVRQH